MYSVPRQRIPLEIAVGLPAQEPGLAPVPQLPTIPTTSRPPLGHISIPMPPDCGLRPGSSRRLILFRDRGFKNFSSMLEACGLSPARVQDVLHRIHGQPFPGGEFDSGLFDYETLRAVYCTFGDGHPGTAPMRHKRQSKASKRFMKRWRC